VQEVPPELRTLTTSKYSVIISGEQSLTVFAHMCRVSNTFSQGRRDLEEEALDRRWTWGGVRVCRYFIHITGSPLNFEID
jgi:hypothetical protein